MRHCEQRELAVRPADRDRKPLIADAKGYRILAKCTRSPRRPIKPLPVDGMKPLKTTQDNRINPQVILIDIALRPRRVIGAEPVLFAIRTDPMINDMIDT